VEQLRVTAPEPAEPAPGTTFPQEQSPPPPLDDRPVGPEAVTLQGPEPSVRRGRPTRSTRRDPSEFETVGARVRRRRAREAGATN
jgi:hypothetical protein